MGEDFELSSLPSPGDRFKLGNKLTSGVWGILYEAEDNKAGKKVSVRVVNLSKERSEELKDEYQVYNAISPHPNIATFLGLFRKKGRADIQQGWVVTELCDGGTVGDYLRRLQKQAKRLPEEHVAYILHELTKAIVHLHEGNVMHRNIRADNIMLTSKGEIKLANMSLCTLVGGPDSKLQSCIGSPYWMAPEVANCGNQEHEGYDLRADVWALGLTAIELGDSKPPLQGIHPARALFQITRNPPPNLFRPANWSQLYNDFISECLEKNPENRPFSQELLEHPFFEKVGETESKVQRELMVMMKEVKSISLSSHESDVMVRGQYMEQEQQSPQRLLQEDLSALENLSEDDIVEELMQRAERKQYYTFVGDVLLSINAQQNQEIFGLRHHAKYQFKARSDNSPHIYTVADKAYQDVMHNEEPQHILFAGETMSGKTTNVNHAIDHLLYLGKGYACVEDVRKSLEVVRAFGTAGTPHNPDSTRHLLQAQITFTTTGKVSGAILWVYLLEKTRVTFPDRKQANFNIFYYFYDALEQDGTLPQWNLEGGRDYQYLRTKGNGNAKPGAREKALENPKHWKHTEKCLHDMGFSEDQLKSVKSILAAILLIGEIEFEQEEEGAANVANQKVVESVAALLGVDQKKLSWALVNHCVVVKGEPTRRRHDVNEAQEARDVLAQGLYSRLVDWIVCKLNEKMSVSRAIFGDRHCVNVMDLFGFECFSVNGLQQLFVNCVNEQLQFHYNQRIFVWEMQEGEEEEVPIPPLPFYDNKTAVDQLLAKPDGLFSILDDSSRGGGISHIMEKLSTNKASHVSAATGSEFTVAHYTGRVTYEAEDFPDKNRDFLPPEMIETMRRSTDGIITALFTGQLSKTGNLTVEVDPEVLKKRKGRWEAALTAEHEKSRARKYNTQSKGQYSQTRQMRTSAAIFRGTCLELLRSLGGSCGVHFVRCLRGNLTGQSGSLQADLLRQQLRALAVLDTARGRQRGYPIRIPFNEFLRRYKFLAFDFDEQVDVTKDNCRLLLIRLKMEGWVIGKTKVFLKYYNEEFLNRLYETQVKKIVKVQSMMRAFLAKRCMKTKLTKSGGKAAAAGGRARAAPKPRPKPQRQLSEDEAATIIQKQVRGSLVRKKYGPTLRKDGIWDQETIDMMRGYCRKWKLKSIYQVLLLYRATRFQDLGYFCQQVHLFNQNALSQILDIEEEVGLKQVDPRTPNSFIPAARPAVHKLPFRLGDLPYFDSTYISEPGRSMQVTGGRDDESWDAPLQRNIGEKYKRSAGMRNFKDQGCQTATDIREKSGVRASGNSSSSSSNIGRGLPETPFVRDADMRGGNKLSEGNIRGMPMRSPSEMSKSQVYRPYNNKQQIRENAPPPPREIVKATKPTYAPIREMEDKFRQISGDTEEAPFNFQAMLKKTELRRSSMKRNDDNRFISHDNRNNNSSFNSGNNNSNVVYKSDFRKKGSQREKENQRKVERMPKMMENGSVELAPGLVLHGEVADL